MQGLTLELAAVVAALVALALLRALAAALEAALVAVGVPRAEELGTGPEARPAARALAALVADPEGTAFAIRFISVLAVLLMGGLAAGAALIHFPGAPLFVGPAAAVVVGLLLVPAGSLGRGLGAAHGEGVALALARPFRLVRGLVGPLSRVAVLVTARRGRFAMPRPPLEEMERSIQEYARASGASAGTSELIRRVFEFREKVARDVMVARTEVVGVEIDTPVPDIIRLLAEEGHSRMPVYRGDLDHIVGVLHARDLVPLLSHPELIVLDDVIRPARFVPWSKPIEQLLREMQRRKLHMAFVVDEFGGVMGLCTIEDVLEEIVGEIQDEFEEEERGLVEGNVDGTFTAKGEAPISELNRLTGADVPEDQGYDTVGGFINSLAGAIPGHGDRFTWRDWVFTVLDADPRRVLRVRAARAKRAP
ncbi:MAG TPA: hemolysin family protein [Anaeromyxobacter sp.]|nr:hemolysin family protein [Anaeromyxobacter sp.]